MVLTMPGLGITMTNTPSAAAYHLGSDGRTWELTSPWTYYLPGSAGQVTFQDLRFDTDPLVYNNILVQNLTAVPQVYSIGVFLPTTFGAPNQIRGSIDTSLIGTDAQVSALASNSIYKAQIDFVPVKTLQDFPFTLSTPQPAVSSSAQFGFDPSGIPVVSTMGIQLTFSLSPGDTVSILSDFEIEGIPEPGVLSLLVLCGGFLVWRRQRVATRR